MKTIKSFILLILSFLLTVGVFASDAKPYKQMTQEEKQRRIAEVQRRRLLHYGDTIAKPGSQKGKIVFVDAQSKVSDVLMKEYVDKLSRLTKLNILLTKRNANLPIAQIKEVKKKLGANVAIFVVEDDNYPAALLVAPEENWAVINVNILFDGAKNLSFMQTRIRKEMSRAFFACSGAMNGQQNGSLMGAVGSPADLDRLSENPPLDVIARTINNLERIGVTRIELAPYLRACQQGWAPAPTNDVQKAIWDKVHAMPTAPIKIKPETKKVKE